MPRHLQTIDKKRAEVILDVLGASGKGLCAMHYVPGLFRTLAESGVMSVQDSIQAVRDLLSLQLLEMHFDKDMKEIAVSDEPFSFPSPGSGSSRSLIPIPYMRLAHQPNGPICGEKTCGANAPDFAQPDLYMSGSYTYTKDEADHTVRFKVDLLSYDEIVVNTSGGKDSQAMLDAVFRECRRLGIEDRIVAYHADLERVEWPGTPELAELQTEYYGVPFDKKARPQGDLLEHVRQHGEWPGTKERYCTSDMKRGQINTLFTRDAKAFHKRLEEQGEPYRAMRILNCIGVRAQESPARSKSKPFQAHHPDYGSSGVRSVDKWYPIFKWKHEDVWETIAQSGVPHHWAYDIGMPRLSCVFCVMGNKAALMLGGEYNPELLEDYVSVEQELLSLPQKMTRGEGKIGTRASKFTAKAPISDVKEALDRGERAAGDIEINSFL